MDPFLRSFGFALKTPTNVRELDLLVQDLKLSHNARLEGKLPEYWRCLTN
jgi:hypothetical protein